MLSDSTRKITINIWTPLLEKFNTKIETACVRRDAYLSRVLPTELQHLDEDIRTPHSEAASRFVKRSLGRLGKTPVSVALPAQCIEQLNDICKRKSIERDAFFNRLLLLLTVPRAWGVFGINPSEEWLKELGRNTPYVRELPHPLRDAGNPFAWLRDFLADESLGENPLDIQQWASNPPHGIYTSFVGRVFGEDLSGFNCYVPESCVPGTEEFIDFDNLGF